VPACRVDDEGLLKLTGSYITTCTVVQPVVKANNQSNGNWQISTPPRGSKTPEWISLKLRIYNYVRGMTTHANPYGAMALQQRGWSLRRHDLSHGSVSEAPNTRPVTTSVTTGDIFGSRLYGRHDGCQDSYQKRTPVMMAVMMAVTMAHRDGLCVSGFSIPFNFILLIAHSPHWSTDFDDLYVI